MRSVKVVYQGETLKMEKKAVVDKVRAFVSERNSPLLLRKDLSELGSSSAVSIALSQLLNEQEIVRIGRGVYARTTITRFSEEPCVEGGIIGVAVEFAMRMGAVIVPSYFELANFEGTSTQVPHGRVVGTSKRITTRLQFDGVQMLYSKEPLSNLERFIEIMRERGYEGPDDIQYRKPRWMRG